MNGPMPATVSARFTWIDWLIVIGYLASTVWLVMLVLRSRPSGARPGADGLPSGAGRSDLLDRVGRSDRISD